MSNFLDKFLGIAPTLILGFVAIYLGFEGKEIQSMLTWMFLFFNLMADKLGEIKCQLDRLEKNK